MSKYYGFLNINVDKEDLVPVLTRALDAVYPMLKDPSIKSTTRLTPKNFTEMASPTSLCEPIRNLEKAFFEELDRRRKEKGDRSFPYFNIIVTIWEKEKGSWLHEPRRLDGSPNWHFERMRSSVWNCSAEIAFYDADYSGRGYEPHRAIKLRVHQWVSSSPATNYDNTVNRLLSDDTHIEEIFDCFKQHYV